jgi:hypothetical protein
VPRVLGGEGRRRGLGFGFAEVFIDRKYVTTTNLYATSSRNRQATFKKKFSSTKTHTLRLLVAGTTGHPQIAVDAFITMRN